jgi:hypothetical protein
MTNATVAELAGLAAKRDVVGLLARVRDGQRSADERAAAIRMLGALRDLRVVPVRSSKPRTWSGKSDGKQPKHSER